jgi:hypothetical protein
MIWIIAIIALICGTIVEIVDIKSKNKSNRVKWKNNIQQWCVGKSIKEIENRLGTCYDKWNKRIYIPGRGYYQLCLKNSKVSCVRKIGW